MEALAQRVETTVRYDGPALAGHEMDVEALAPALLSLAALIQLANVEINGSDAHRIRVVIDANTEQKCFQIKLKAILDAYDIAKDFFGGAEAASLKNLIEWLGIIGGPPLTLLKVLKMIAKREAAKPTTTFNAGDNAAIFNVAGDVNFNGISPEVLKLLANPTIVEKAKGFLAPVEREGYSSVALYDDKGAKVFEADKNEAKAIMALPSPADLAQEALSEDDAVHTPIRGRASIITRSDVGEAKWRLKWTGQASPVTMPHDWLADYQAGRVNIPVGSWLDVTIEMTTSRTDPDATPTYKVLTVHDVIPPASGGQMDMLDDNA